MPASTARLSAALLFLLACLTVSDAFAANRDNEWKVVTTAGAVTVAFGEPRQERTDIRAGALVHAPLTVRTGGDGHLVIAHGADTLTVGPDSLFEIPEPEARQQGIATRINQTLGSVLYQVEHRLKDVFEVQTPYLVSVVKGTTFNILVIADSTTVALIEGRLLVYTPDKKAEVLLEAGQAAVRSAHDKEIRVKDQQSLSAPVAGPITIARGGHPRISAVDNMTIDPRGLSVELGGTIDGGAITGTSVNTRSIRLPDINIGDNTRPVLALGESSLNLGDARIGGTTILSVAIEESSLDLGSVSIGGTGLTPAIDIGGASVNLGGVALDLGATPGISLGDTSITLGAVSVGGTALTPDITLGETTVNIGNSGIGVTTDLNLGIVDPPPLNVEITGPGIVTGILSPVETTIANTTTNLAPIVGTVTGLLPHF